MDAGWPVGERLVEVSLAEAVTLPLLLLLLLLRPAGARTPIVDRVRTGMSA